MPTVLANTPQGVLYQNEDGSVVLLPPGADQAPPPDLGAPPLDPGTQAIDMQSGAPAVPDQGPVPDVAFGMPIGQGGASQGVPQAPPPAGSVTAPVGGSVPSQVAPPSASGGAGGPTGGAGGSPAGAGATIPAPPATGSAAPLDPFEQEAAAALSAGEAAAAKHDEEQATLAARNARLDEMQGRADKLNADNDARKLDLRAKMDAATSAYADHKISEPEPGWGQIIAMVLGGIGQVLNRGDKNPVIEQWDRMAAENVRKQELDRARLGDLADRAGKELDRFVSDAADGESRFARRMAGESERFARELEVTASKYGGKTAKANADAAAAQVRQKGAAYLDQALERDWSHRFQEKQFTAEQANQRANRAVSWANLKQGDRHFDETMKQRRAEMDLDAQKLEQQGKIAEAKALRDASKEDEKALLFDPLTGKPIGVIRDEVQKRQVQDAVNATASVAKGLDTLIRLADKADGASGIIKSAEWQEITANKEFIKQQIRMALKMGTLDAGAAASMEKILGGADPTSFIRDATPGLKAARQALQNNANDMLRGSGITNRWEVPDMSAPAAAPRDEDLEALSGSTGFASPEAPGGSALFDKYTPAKTATNPHALDRSQQIGLENLVRRVEEGDTAAATNLAEVATGDGPANTRAAAAAALIQLKQSGNQVAADLVRQKLQGMPVVGGVAK